MPRSLAKHIDFSTTEQERQKYESELLNPSSDLPEEGIHRFANMTANKKRRFLEVFRKTGNVRLSADAASVSRQNVYYWQEKDAEFAQAMIDCYEDSTDVLEQEAVRRAMGGSDVLLIFELKGRRPHKYRDVLENKVSGNLTQRIEYVNDWRGAESSDDSPSLPASGATAGETGIEPS